MHGVAFPITQLLGGFNLDRALGNRHALAQFPAPVVAPIAFTVALSTVPKVQVKQSATSFIHIDKTVNPLMSDGLIGPFQLQALSDLLGAKPLAPARAEDARAAILSACRVCVHCAGERHFAGLPRLPLGRLSAITANLPTDRRGMYAQLFCDADLGHAAGQTSLDLVTLIPSQLPVMRSHLRLNPWV
jgi:hypothetical protein